MVKFWNLVLSLSASVQILFRRKEHYKPPLKCCEREIKLYYLSLKLAREGSSACHGKRGGRQESMSCLHCDVLLWTELCSSVGVCQQEGSSVQQDAPQLIGSPECCFIQHYPYEPQTITARVFISKAIYYFSSPENEKVSISSEAQI